jgi:fibronectin type 3 domain-containing protein
VDPDPTVYVASVPGGATSYVAANLTFGVVYDFQVRAMLGAVPTPLSAVATATPAAPPGAPSNLAVQVVASNAATLTWDPVAGATRYLVYQGPSAGSEVLQASVTGTSYQNNHLIPGEHYAWYVRAEGFGAQLSVPSTTVEADMPFALDTPANVAAEAISTERIYVTWDPVPLATHYYVYRTGPNNMDFSYVGTVLDEFYNSAALAASSEYGYAIVAADSGNAVSDMSAPVFATTLTAP